MVMLLTRSQTRTHTREKPQEMWFAGFEQRSVEQNWLEYKNKLLSLIDRFVPKRKVPSNPRSPWFNNTLKRMRNKKEADIQTRKIDSQNRPLVILSDT